ncbi:MAG: glycosyltransferase family 2 protein [Fimbriimonadales bacterium]|nr:glycosyltransferase family 2 protein [Armatimonadota bacterium]MCX7686776.1 glycosyltransferase family 2 protein [Fimbriimonadales bacterium]CUU05523.1 dolichyl-phosphate beta-glucosyltransferase [Armatimonadetes bacterium GBS]CUU36155.1 dolichyl-phosphate beta-glucosyltransferase [Armatimonadetes bacterium GXS]GBC90017.1 Undecaprenyl-phosphate 4-deoxy-4-formamido-L-arabinose transferase [bacterium HR14]
MKPDLRLSVVIPAYNEEARIESTLERVIAYLNEGWQPYEILVVSDGSTDRTEAIVQAFAARHPQVKLLAYQPNRGKGHAVRYGMLRAQGEWVLFSDADLATPIEELEKLARALESGYAIAIGSRPLRESQLIVRQPFYREWAGRAFNKVVQLLAVRGIHDTQCGFKLFTREAVQAIFPRCQLDGFSFDFEALYYAQRMGYPIAEVPVRWMHQEGSKVRLLRDGLRMLRDLVWLRLHAMRQGQLPQMAPVQKTKE